MTELLFVLLGAAAGSIIGTKIALSIYDVPDQEFKEKNPSKWGPGDI